MKVNKTLLISAIVVLVWLYSLFLVFSNTQDEYERRCKYKELRAFDNGRSEARSEISRAPYIPDSLLATEVLHVEVTDTYFAKGTTLIALLKETISSHGLGGFGLSPIVVVYIDGNAKGVNVRVKMYRHAYLKVSDDYLRDKKRYYNSEYKGDCYVRDFITIFTTSKYFSENTQYEEVAKWLETEMANLCAIIKVKNTQVTEELNKNYKEMNE